MKKLVGNVYLLVSEGMGEKQAQLIVKAAARRSGVVMRLAIRPKAHLRQVELLDTSVALAISLFGGIAAPPIIDFISRIASKLRKKRFSIAIGSDLAEAIGREIVSRYTEPSRKVRLMSFSELAKGKGFKLLFRQRDNTYTVRLNQYGQLQAVIRH